MSPSYFITSKIADTLTEPLLPGASCYRFKSEELATEFDSTDWQRMAGRDALIALKCLEEFLKTSLLNRHLETGFYGAFNNGPYLNSEVQSINHIFETSAYETVRKKWPPRQHFKQMAPIKLSMLSIFMNLKGRLFCTTDPLRCVSDALDLIEVDLFSGSVEQALLVSAFSIEEPLVLKAYLHEKSENFFESGFVTLLNKANFSDFALKYHRKPKSYSYGPCSSVLGDLR